MGKEKKGLNSSSLTTCDPSSQSNRKKPKKRADLSRSVKKIPKNTPRSSESVSLIYSAPIFKSFSIVTALSPESLEEIKDFKEKKIQEYKKTLENCLNHSTPSPYIIAKREKLRICNEKADQKRKELLEIREFEEKKRLKQSQSMKLSNLYHIMAKKNEKIKKQRIFKEKVEKEKNEKEAVKEEEVQKCLVLENIRNFYTDRIDEVKNKIEEERTRNKMIQYEKRRSESSFRQEKKKIKEKSLKYLI